jgi:hypothetical protein
LLFRARSPSGLMLPSMDSPQGDHVDRIPAMIAAGKAISEINSGPTISLSRFCQAAFHAD